MNIGTIDKLDLMISLVAKDCGNDDVEMLDNLDTSSVELDKYFYRKRDRIVAKHKHYSAILILRKGLLRVAIAILIIMSLGFTTVMAITPLREAIFETVIEWYEDYLTIRYEPVGEGENNMDEDKGEGVLDNDETPTPDDSVITPPAIIEEVKKPAYIPEGMIEDILIQNDSLVCIDYYLGEEYAYTYNQMLMTDTDKFVDNEGAIVETVDINGNEGSIIRHAGSAEISILWSDGEYIYQVVALSTPLDELLFVCRSVS